MRAQDRPSDETMILIRLIRTLTLCAAVASTVCAQAPPSALAIKSVRANGVTLHYIEQGKGPPVVLVHGGLEDYRSWEPQMAGFGEHHRVVAYSRRYNYPNSGAPKIDNYSALVDAEDLAALLKQLKLAPAHLVGISYGAYTALLVAVKHPELVRSLVLCEPPLLRWLPELEGGQPLFAEFMGKVWEPTTRGFQQGDEPGLKAAIDGFGSLGYALGAETASFASLPAEVRSVLLENALEWKTLTQSRDAFPDLPFAAVRIRRSLHQNIWNGTADV